MTKRTSPAAVVWFTGLSGAGKSALAMATDWELRRRGLRTEYIDGDAVRLVSPTGFTRVERDAHVLRVGALASELERQNVSVLCALISPYADTRARVRSLCRRFIEVHVATSLEDCERSDVKGLYARARRGEITNFTGVDDPYEPPTAPELVIDTNKITVHEAVGRIIEVWEMITGHTGDKKQRPVLKHSLRPDVRTLPRQDGGA